MEFFIDVKALQRIIRLLINTAKIKSEDASEKILITAEVDGKVTFFSNNVVSLSLTTNDVEVEVGGVISLRYEDMKMFLLSFKPWDGTCGLKVFHFSKINDKKFTIFVKNVNKDGSISNGSIIIDHYQFLDIQTPEPFKNPTFILNNSLFKTAIDKVIYAINPLEKEPSIKGMNIKFSDKIYFAGTDGVQLSEYMVDNPTNIKDNSVLLSRDFVTIIRRILSDEDQIFFEISNTDAKVKFGNVCVWSKLNIGHVFPDYSSMFTLFNNVITLDKQTFIDVLSPLIHFLDDDDYNRLKISIKNNKMVLSCASGNFEYPHNVDYVDDYVVNVNGKHLRETIESISDSKFTFKFSDDSEKFIIFDSDSYKDQQSLIAVLRGH